MEYKRFDNSIVLRLDPGEEITASILKIAENEKIRCASISGIGAVDDVTVGMFDMEKRTYARFSYTGNHEITNLCGNLSIMDEKPYQHLHITLAAPDGSIRGGHLLSAVISLTAEIVITIIPGTLDRARNNAIGINTIRP